MYVGNGCFIEAPHTGDVIKISSLDGRSDFLTGRRNK
jgi:peptidoglycan DL-endopeptidase CwlO